MFRAPAFFGELLDVGCRIRWASRSSFGVEYRIRPRDSDVGRSREIAGGETVQEMYDFRTSRVSRLPADLLALFESWEGHAVPQRGDG